MKAATSLLAVLLTLSCPSLAQTAPVQPTIPAQTAVPAQEAAPTQPAVPAEQAVPAQPMPPAQQATQPTAAGSESSKPEAASQPSTPAPAPAASTASPEAAAASPDAAPAAPAVSAARVFAPGATLFIEPMAGFEQRLAYAMTRKKVPVVLVKESAKADFILSGGARVKNAGWIRGWVESAHGKGSISIQNAHTGEQVFAYKFNRADTNTTLDQIYQNWADACAKHLKKTMEKEVKREEVAASR